MKYKQLPLSSSAQKLGLDQYLAVLPHNWNDLENRCGIKFEDEADMNGLGPAKLALLKTDSNKRFLLYNLTNCPDETTIMGPKPSPSYSDDLDEILGTLGYMHQDCTWISPDIIAKNKP